MPRQKKDEVERSILEEIAGEGSPKGTPDSVKVLSFGRGRMHIEFFDSFEDARPFLERPMQGVRDLQDYLSGVDFLREKDFELNKDIRFQIAASKRDLSYPNLAGIYKDPRIIVKPVKKFGKIVKIRAKVNYQGGDEEEREFERFYTADVRLTRGYVVGDPINPKDERDMKYRLVVQRPPVIADIRDNDIYNYSNLARLVLSNQLEPFTSNNFMKRLERSGYDWSLDLGKIIDEVLKEETLLSDAVASSWLIGVKGYEEKEVLDNEASSFSYLVGQDRRRALSQVQKHGPKKVIEHYGDVDSWNLDDFLSGEWAR